MAENRVEVKTYTVTYTCDECKKGAMKPTGEMLTSHPPQFPHRCDNPECGHQMTFNIRYPYMDQVPVEEIMCGHDSGSCDCSH